jgi:hypothetical protein
MSDEGKMVYAVFSDGDSLFIERIFFSLSAARSFIKLMPEESQGEFSIFQYNGETGEEVGEISK